MTWFPGCESGHRRDKAQPLLMSSAVFLSSVQVCRQVKDPLAVHERIKTLQTDLALDIDNVEGLMRAETDELLNQIDGLRTECASF